MKIAIEIFNITLLAFLAVLSTYGLNEAFGIDTNLGYIISGVAAFVAWILFLGTFYLVITDKD